MDTLRYAFAGIWPLVAGYGTGVLIVLGALAFAWFSPIFKKTALWVAFGAGVFTIAYGIGVSNGESRVRAQWKAAEAAQVKKAKSARARAVRTVGKSVGVRNDRYERNHP